MSSPDFSSSPASSRPGWLRGGLRDARLRIRLCAALLRRLKVSKRLSRAEIELGCQGWQQAEYYGEAETANRQIQEFERKQAGVLNSAGEAAAHIEALERTHSEETQRSDEALRPLAQKMDICEAELKAVDTAMEQARVKIAGFVQAIEGINRDIGLVEEEFKSSRQRITMPSEWERIRSRLVTQRAELLAEQSDFDTRKKSLSQELAADEHRFATLAARLEECRAALQSAEKLHAKAAVEREKQIAEHRKIKLMLEKEIYTVEKRKDDYFLKLGRVLADSGLPPRNQPEILDRVLLLREQDGILSAGIQELKAEIRSTPPETKLLFYGVLIVVLLTVSLICLKGDQF